MIYFYFENINLNYFFYLICINIVIVFIGLSGKLYLLDKYGNWILLKNKDFIIM